MAEITLNIKIAPSGEKFEIKVDKTAAVEEFKRLVTEKSSVPADQQRLIYKGHVLRDQRTLASYGIDNDHTVLLVRGVKAEEKAASAPASSSESSAANTPPNSAASPPLASANNAANPAANAANPFGMFFGGPMGGAMGDMGAEEGDGAANPFGGMGMDAMMGNPQMMANMLNNPMMMQMVQQMMNNPQMMEMMINMNPMLRNMPPAMQAQVRQVMGNPQLMQAMLNPQNLQAMMQMQQAMGQMRGGPLAQMFGQPGAAPAQPAAAPAQPAAAQPGAAAAPQADPFAALMQMMMQPPAAQPAAAQPAAAQPAAAANAQPAAADAAPAAAPVNPLMQPGFMQAMMEAMRDGQQNHNLGMFGPPRGAAAAGPAERPEMVYRNQLATLNDMGFHNLEANLNALMATGGNIEAAVDRLTSGR